MTSDLSVDTAALRTGAESLADAAAAFRGDLGDASCLPVTLTSPVLGTDPLALETAELAGRRMQDAVAAALRLHDVARQLSTLYRSAAESFEMTETGGGLR